MTHFIHAFLVDSARAKTANPQRRKSRYLATPTPVVNGVVRLRIDYEIAAGSHKVRLDLMPGETASDYVRVQPSGPQYVELRPNHSGPYKVAFTGLRTELSVMFLPRSRQRVNAANSAALAKEIFREALHSGTLEPDRSKGFESEIVRFLKLWLEQLGSPQNEVFLEDLALVLADLAAVNLSCREVVKRGVPELVKEVRRSLAGIGHRKMDCRSDDVVVGDVLDAYGNAMSKVLQEQWTPITDGRPKLDGDTLRRVENFRKGFTPLAANVDPRRSAEQRGGPIAMPLAVRHQFRQMVWTYLSKLMSQRFVDEQRAAIRHDQALGEYQGETERGNGPFHPDPVGGDQREPWSPPHKPSRAIMGLATELHRQVEEALDAEAGESLELDHTHKLAQRIMRNSHRELIAALSTLPHRRELTTKKLHADPSLVVQMKLPTYIRQPRAVKVQVGVGCANYLGKTNKTRFKQAVQEFLQNLQG